MNPGRNIFQGIGQPKAIARIAAITDASVEELEAISYGPYNPIRMRYKGVAIPAAFLWMWRDRRRVCPDCLRESLYQRAAWDLSFSTWCLKHRRRLISSCPTCERTLTWDCDDLNGCPCGSCDLMSIPTDDEQPDPDDLHAIAVALGLLGEERHSHEAARIHALMPLSELQPADALEFVCRLGSDLIHPDYNHFGIARFGKGWGGGHVINKGIEAIQAWPCMSLDPWPCAADSGVPPRKPKNLYARRVWQRNMERWLADLPLGTGQSIREFVAAHPVYAPSMEVK